MGISAGLVDLLANAGQSESIPAWLQGMAHVSNARSREEDMKIQAGSATTSVNTADDVVNEEFSEQDFRRTAAEGSYGAGKDTSFRSFDDNAYNDSSVIDNEYTDDFFADSETDGNSDYTSLDDELEVSSDEEKHFRQQPSKQLLKAIERSSGTSQITDTPDNNVLNSLKGNQLLRLEYIGLFPFNLISSLLMNTTNNQKIDMPKVLMVAEKPSIAKAIAESLSGKRPPRQRRGISRALPVYEFETDSFHPINNGDGKSVRHLVRVTSVVGHVYSLGFDFDQREQRNNPRDYFRMEVTKKEEGPTSKLRVVDHLKALAGDSEHLVLWLDCDAVSISVLVDEFVLYLTNTCFDRKGRTLLMR